MEAEAERIRLDKRVKIVWFLPTAAALFFILIICLFYFMMIQSDPLFVVTKSNYIYALPLIFIAIAALVYGWLELTYRNFTYQLDEHEIIMRQGVLARDTTAIPYAAIQDVRSERSILERMLGLATIEIETAASKGKSVSEILLPGIANKDSLMSEIMEKVQKAKRGLGTEAREANVDTAKLLSDILVELKTISLLLMNIGKKNGGAEKKSGKEAAPKSAFESYERFRNR